MTDKVVRFSDIVLKVGLDENNNPIEMNWMAQDNPNGMDPLPCKSILLSIFDAENKDTLKIDLWTTEMQVAEMDRFMYQTLRGLADTYQRATNNLDLSNQMQKFVQYFGESTDLLPKSDIEV